MKGRAQRVAVALWLLLPLALVQCQKKLEPPRRCADNGACPSNEFCEFSPGLCGKGQSPGTCRSKRESCTGEYQPVCACDGKVYDNECSARAAGKDLAVMGGCGAQLPSYAACGAHYCDARQSYCEILPE